MWSIAISRRASKYSSAVVCPALSSTFSYGFSIGLSGDYMIGRFENFVGGANIAQFIETVCGIPSIIAVVVKTPINLIGPALRMTSLLYYSAAIWLASVVVIGVQLRYTYCLAETNSGALQFSRSWSSFDRRCDYFIRFFSSWHVAAARCSRPAFSLRKNIVAVASVGKAIRLSNVSGRECCDKRRDYMPTNEFLYTPDHCTRTSAAVCICPTLSDVHARSATFLRFSSCRSTQVGGSFAGGTSSHTGV